MVQGLGTGDHLGLVRHYSERLDYRPKHVAHIAGGPVPSIVRGSSAFRRGVTARREAENSTSGTRREAIRPTPQASRVCRRLTTNSSCTTAALTLPARRRRSIVRR